MIGGPFYGKYAVLSITGVDGNSYVTVIDKNGTIQFEPFQVKEIRHEMFGGNFIVKGVDEKWTVYNAKGELLQTYADWRGISWIQGGYAFVWGPGIVMLYGGGNADPE